METGSAEPACTDDDESTNRKAALGAPVGRADASAVDKEPTKTSTPSTGTPNELTGKIQELEKELAQLRPLKTENQRLRRCVGGVSVLGRALTETKKELKDLRTLLHGDGSTTDQQPPSDTKDQDVSFNIPDIVQPPHDEVVSPLNINEEEAAPEHQEGEESVPEEGTKCFNDDETRQDDDGAVQTVPQVGPVGRNHETQVTGNTTQMPKEGNEDVTQDSKKEIRSGDGEITSQAGVVKEMKTETDDDLTDADFQEADLTSVEAMIKEFSAPTQSGLTGPTSDARSVTAIAEQSGSDIKQKLAKKFSLQMQVQELTKCNRDWERFWSTKKSEFNARQEENDMVIRELEEQLKSARADITKRLAHHDQMLLAAKTRIDDLKESDNKLQSEVQKERARANKLEQLNRNLTKQNQKMTDEISRLKEALERHYQQKASSSKHPPKVRSAIIQPLDPREKSPESSRNQSVSKRPVTPPKVAEGRPWNPQPLKAPGDADVEAVSTRPKSPPVNSGRQPRDGGRHSDRPVGLRVAGDPVHGQENGVPDKSLSRPELKEQLELLRQQNLMYESDFRKERGDRESAMNKLGALQRELDKLGTGRAEGHGLSDKTKAHALKRVPRTRAAQAPKPPSPRELAPRKQKVLPQASKEVTVVQWGETGQVVHSNIVIFPPGAIKLGGAVETKRSRSRKLEPFQCPRCQRLFTGNEWEAFDYHVGMCNV